MPRGVASILLILVLVPSEAFSQTSTPPWDRLKAPRARREASPPPASSPAAASVPDASHLFTVGTSEWMVTTGFAWGVQVFHSASGYQYVMQTISWGRVLSNPKLSGPLRGRFEWVFQGTPLYAQYQPYRAYGFGVEPLVWRWNFEPSGRYAPYAELAGGALWTSAPVPSRTTSANFTAHAGAGLRMLIGAQHALVLAYRFDHISNGNRVDPNPGVNAHAVHLGLSLMLPRK